MPWRLIGFVLLGAMFLCFIGFNLENRCDISVGFYTFSQVPVFLTAFSAFVLGLFLALVISFRSGFRRKKKAEPAAGQDSGGKKKKTAKTASSGSLPSPPDNGYGIH
ncbi:MAG: hypothetical protein LBI94_06000 [Treponema sp.]|jgi:uncharacterized integral membrane protein|nr:hypothetical protein [Treponema sp.]